MNLNKKGQQVNLGNFGVIILMFAIAVIMTVVTTDIVTDVKTDIRSGSSETAVNCETEPMNCTSAAYNVSGAGELGLLNVADQYGNIGTVIGAAIIIAILLGAFAFYRMGGGGGVSFQ